MAARRSLTETRQAILAAGSSLMAETGRTFDAANISLIDACRRAGLGTAGSGYKIWATQDEFRVDLQRYALVEAGPSAADDVGERLAESVGKLGPDPDITNLLRVTSTESAATVTGTAQFVRAIALWLAASEDAELRSRQIASQRELLGSLTELYRGLLDHFGMEMRPPFTVEMLALAIAAETHGIGYFCSYVDDIGVDDIERQTGADGAVERWHLLGCVVEGIVRSFTRPIEERR